MYSFSSAKISKEKSCTKIHIIVKTGEIKLPNFYNYNIILSILPNE